MSIKSSVLPSFSDPTLESTFNDLYTSAIITSSLSNILDKAFSTISANYISENIPSYLSKTLLSDISNIIELQSILRDIGDIEDDEKWECEKEPIPISIDLLARGAIPIKRRVKQSIVVETMQNNSALSIKSSDQLSTGSRTSKASKFNPNRTGAGFKGIKSGSATANADLLAIKPISIEKKPTPEELNRDRIRDEMLLLLQRKQKASEKAVQNAEVAAEETKKQVKVKDSDKTNASVYSDKLPNLTLEPLVDVPNVPSIPTLSGSVKKKIVEKKEVKKEKKDESFTVGAQSAPVLEVIKLAAGVTFKEGGNVRTGPAPTYSSASISGITMGTDTVALAKTLTRKAYNEMIDSLSTVPLQNALLTEDFVEEPSKDTKSKEKSAKEKADEARKAALRPETPLTAKGIPQGSILTDTYGVAGKLSAIEIYNESLVSDPSWGSNPPLTSVPLGQPLPIKKLNTHLPLTSRDRPFISPVASSATQRHHLPAPSLGQTVGHGQIPLYETMKAKVNEELNPQPPSMSKLGSKSSIRTERAVLSSSQSKVQTTNLGKTLLQQK